MSENDRHEHHIHHNSGGTNFSSVLLGAAIGATITYLFANKEGQKVRDQLLKEGTRLLDEVADKVQEMQEKVESGKVQEQLSEKIEDVKKSVGEIEQIVEEVPGHIERIQKKGRRFFFRKPHPAES